MDLFPRTESPRPRGLLLVWAVAATMTCGAAAQANTGEIAYAYPIENVTIDGDLSDWGEGRLRFSIERGSASDSEPGDFEASFQVAHDLAKKSLYVAVEVVDDEHINLEGAVPGWGDQDNHLLYVDREHLPTGSGGVLYLYGDRIQEVTYPMASWDPANAGASWDDVEVASRRDGKKTVYEWRVDLGDDLALPRTIGLDHLLVDRDSQSEDDGTLFFWGEGLGKSANTYRMGDVALLEAETALVTLEGVVSWSRAIDEPLPSKVRITSVDRPDLWLQASVGEDGRYSLKVPTGDFLISSPFGLTKPFSEDQDTLPLRIDMSTQVRVRAEPDGTSLADPLRLRTFDRPDFLFPQEGVLSNFHPGRTLEIDTFIEAFRQYYQVPGASVSLIHDGKLAYHRTFGVKNTLTGEPVTDTTLFEAASITKSVFAFAVMRLVERGVIDLDKPLFEYLPFNNISGDPRSKSITARIVLSHRSGLTNWPWGGPGTFRNGGTADLKFEPGSAYEYSGEAFNYLGRVIEKLTGKTLSEVLDEEVSRPMGLENTYYALNEEQAEVASIGHFHYFPIWKGRASEVSPASSMHSEARDFSNFAIGLIEGRGVSTETYAEMLKPHSRVPRETRLYADPWEQDVGLGFFLRETPIGQLVEHGGNNGDFDCKFGVVREAGVGFVIFTNNNVGDELARALELFLLDGSGALSSPQSP